MAKLKLGEVGRKISLADMMKTSHGAALEETPDRFEIG
jgi:hypothetical protein